jgi:hypothetical protein
MYRKPVQIVRGEAYKFDPKPCTFPEECCQIALLEESSCIESLCKLSGARLTILTASRALFGNYKQWRWPCQSALVEDSSCIESLCKLSGARLTIGPQAVHFVEALRAGLSNCIG